MGYLEKIEQLKRDKQAKDTAFPPPTPVEDAKGGYALSPTEEDTEGNAINVLNAKSSQPPGGPVHQQRQSAITWLCQELLAGHNDSDTLIQAAKAKGWSERLLRGAAASLKVVSKSYPGDAPSSTRRFFDTKNMAVTGAHPAADTPSARVPNAVLPFPLGFGGLPEGPVNQALTDCERSNVTDPVLVWLRVFRCVMDYLKKQGDAGDLHQQVKDRYHEVLHVAEDEDDVPWGGAGSKDELEV